MQHAAFEPPAPPPDRPELPEGAGPRWPAWYAGIGFLVALIATTIVVGILVVATDVDPDDPGAAFTVVGTFIQAMIFIATGVTFASFTRRPRAEHFGLRATRFWSGVGWATLGMAAFYALVAIYSVVLHPDAEQTVAEDLGADQGTLGMIAAGFMVICVAPFAEEFFFRGFFYRALRSRWSVLGAAAIDGLLFGAIHFAGAGGDALLILPPLGVLGFIFCLVYERTGSIWPTIAMHAFNNAIAFGVTLEDGTVSLVLGPLMLLACAVIPRAQRTAMA